MKWKLIMLYGEGNILTRKVVAEIRKFEGTLEEVKVLIILSINFHDIQSAHLLNESSDDDSFYVIQITNGCCGEFRWVSGMTDS